MASYWCPRVLFFNLLGRPRKAGHPKGSFVEAETERRREDALVVMVVEVVEANQDQPSPFPSSSAPFCSLSLHLLLFLSYLRFVFGVGLISCNASHHWQGSLEFYVSNVSFFLSLLNEAHTDKNKTKIGTKEMNDNERGGSYIST